MIEPSFAEKFDYILTRHLAFLNYKSYVNRIKLKGDEKVLEVGCGTGNLSRFLVAKLSRGELTCIDNTTYCIKKTKKRLRNYKNIKFELNDILNLTTDNYFDVVIIHFVLHDINSEKRNEALSIVNKSLRRGGKIFIREPTRKSHGMSSKEIEKLILGEGFQKVSSKEGHSFPLRGKVYEGDFYHKFNSIQ